MDISRYFDRIDIYKGIVLLILLAVLMVLILLWGTSTGLVAGGGERDKKVNTPQATQAGEAESFPGLPTMDSSDENVAQLPQFPQTEVVLRYEVSKGVLVTPDGKPVYILSADKKVWIPILPQSLADRLKGAVPRLDAGGVWIIVSPDGQDEYRWDEVHLVWLKVVKPMANATPIPGEEEETEVVEAAVTATPTLPPTETETNANEGVEATEETSTGSTPVLPVPTVTPGLPKTYTVRAGEFVYCIARRFDVDPYQLSRASGLPSPSLVHSGTKLTIPQDGDPFPGKRTLKAHPTWHVVKKGETIYSIACEYGDVYPYAIAYANGLSEPYKLNVGDEIYVP